MESGVKETFQKQKVIYEAHFCNQIYLLERSYLQFKGKEEVALYAGKKEKARLTSGYFKKPIFKKVMTIDPAEALSDQLIALYIVLLNVVFFI